MTPQDPQHALSHPDHLAFLQQDFDRQVDFFRASLGPGGRIETLDVQGRPLAYVAQELHTTTRLVHSYAAARAWGAGRVDPLIDAGMAALTRWHFDADHDGYHWSVRQETPVDSTKMAYGHVFVLLAATSALQVGHEDAPALLAHIDQTLDRYFWDAEAGRLTDEFDRTWQPFSTYRGMNANMHGAEAYLAAFEATGREVYLSRAKSIFDFFIGQIAPAHDWRIPEHYDDRWRVDGAYAGDPMFRPRGSTPGHSFEWARLLLQYGELADCLDEELIAKARALVDRALDAWMPAGGFAYTLKGHGEVDQGQRYWWPVTEAIGACAVLIRILDDAGTAHPYGPWYARLWQFAQAHLIDAQWGGWFPELGPDNQPGDVQFQGKPDLYHALQATIIPRATGAARMFFPL